MRKFMILAAITMATAFAQQCAVLFGFGKGPGVEASIRNDTDDGTLVRLSVNSKATPVAFSRGGGMHWFFKMGQGTVPISIEACGEPHAVLMNGGAYLKDWMMDDSSEGLGKLALTKAYLHGIHGVHSGKLLEARLKNIKQLLKTDLQRESRYAELEIFLREAKENGLADYPATACSTSKIINVVLRVPECDFQRRAAMLVVSGNAQEGYRLEGPRQFWVY